MDEKRPKRRLGPRIKIPIIATLVIMSLVVGAKAADVREGMRAPPDKIIERMFESAEKGDFEKVRAGLSFLQPLTVHIDEALGADVGGGVRTALAGGNQEEVIRSLQQYLVSSMRVLLTECLEAGTGTAAIKQKLRFLLAEKHVLEPYVKAIDVGAASSLQRKIQEMAAAAGHDPAVLAAKAAELEAVLVNVLP